MKVSRTKQGNASEANSRQLSFGNVQTKGGSPFFKKGAPSIQKQNPPAASQLQDTRVRVQQADRAMYDDLRNFIRSLPQDLTQLLQSPPPNAAWIDSNNPNVQEVQRILAHLIGDLTAENLIIRFDQAAGSAAASYDHLNNEMHLRPFSNDGERHMRAVDLFHEYTHVEQDRSMERTRATQRTPQVRTAAQELQKEIDARRTQVYFSGLIRAAGHRFSGPGAFSSEVNDRVFLGRFERERTGNAQESAAATQEIENVLGREYRAQVARGTSVRMYSITIANNNHAMLHHDINGQPSPFDLGAISNRIANTEVLKGLLASDVSALSFFPDLFNNPAGGHFNLATFMVTYNNTMISEFGLNKP